MRHCLRSIFGYCVVAIFVQFVSRRRPLVFVELFFEYQFLKTRILHSQFLTGSDKLLWIGVLSDI